MKKAFCRAFKINPRDFSIPYGVFTVFNYLLMAVLFFVWLYPILNVVFMSLSNPDNVLRGDVTFWPKGFDASSYKMVWNTMSLRTGLLNSLFYAGVGAVVGVFCLILTAYPLSKKRLVFRSAFTILLSITMFFDGGLIPTFLVVNGLGLYNTRAWIIMAALFAPWHIIMMRTFFQGLPVELEESAYLDGANDMQVMLRIHMPLSIPVIATLGLFTIVGYWNSYLTPLVYLMDSSKMPLQVALRDLIMLSGDGSIFMQQVTAELSGIDHTKMVEKLKYTTIVVTMIPMVILFLATQRYFKQGVLIGSIKG